MCHKSIILSRDQHMPSFLTWCFYSLVVIRVDTHFILLRVEGVLAQLDRPQLMVGLQVGPAPQTAVDDVRETFSVGYLQTAIQRPADRKRGGTICQKKIVRSEIQPRHLFQCFSLKNWLEFLRNEGKWPSCFHPSFHSCSRWILHHFTDVYCCYWCDTSSWILDIQHHFSESRTHISWLFSVHS